MVEVQGCVSLFCEQHPGGPNAIDWLIIVDSVLGILAILVLITVPFALLARRKANRAGPTMTMRFRVGVDETHSVDVAFTQPTERLVVRVDDHQVIDQSFAAGFRLARSVEFSVGSNELHTVTISKTRQRLYGGLNPQQFTATVDGTQVAAAESRYRRAATSR